MPQRVNRFSQGQWLLIQVFVPVAVIVVSYILTKSAEFTATWGLIAIALSLIGEVLAQLKAVVRKVETLHVSMPCAYLLCDYLSIHLAADDLFNDFARSEMEKFQTTLDGLKAGEAVLDGESSVFATYSKLIDRLEPNETYKATTFVEGTFWERAGGRSFLEHNLNAVRRGAKVTRIFFHRDDSKIPVRDTSAVPAHLDALSKLDHDQKRRFQLRSLEISGRDVKDMGILQENYLMRITKDQYGQTTEARVTKDEKAVNRAMRDWEALFDTSEPIMP